MKVAICIPTYLRPKTLGLLLESVCDLHLEGLDTAVIVADNDAKRSAEIVVQGYKDRIPSLRYVVEPQRSLSAVRNRLVQVAEEAEADFIAFVDDDETVGSDWLGQLVKTALEYRADVVTGPVTPKYTPGVAPWIKKGRFFEREQYSTGTRLTWARTGNALIRLSVLLGLEGPFDARFALTGGEDTHMFARVVRRGGTIVWDATATAFEVVPLSRCSAKWILNRAFRTGNTLAICDASLGPQFTRLFFRVAKGFGRVLIGLIMLAPSTVRGKAGVVAALVQVNKGLGMFAGLLGFHYREYVRVHGE